MKKSVKNFVELELLSSDHGAVGDSICINTV